MKKVISESPTKKFIRKISQVCKSYEQEVRSDRIRRGLQARKLKLVQQES